jgi:tRNA pseudouridine38-40 synthase
MRWKCQVAYDGTDFEGWQAQPGGNTVQQHLERRLSFLFDQPVRIHGAGRTDSGVHARGQVFHVDAPWKHGAETLLKALRTGIPDSIQVFSVEEAGEDFHARFSATGKRYVYRLFEGYAPPFENRYTLSLRERQLDLERINEAAALLIGRHDFSAFGAKRSEDSAENPVKELRKLELTRNGPRLLLVTEGSGYLYKMVRSLAGCLIDVGRGRLRVSQVAEILAGAQRTGLVCTAPAHGLTLERVDYPGEKA